MQGTPRQGRIDVPDSLLRDALGEIYGLLLGKSDTFVAIAASDPLLKMQISHRNWSPGNHFDIADQMGNAHGNSPKNGRA